MDEDNSEQRRSGGFRRPNGRHIRTPTTRGEVLWSPDAEPLPPAWRIEAFEADDGTVPFDRFAMELPDFKWSALFLALERVLAVRGLDLARHEWLKPLGDGLHEFRIRHDAPTIMRMSGGDPGKVATLRGRVLLRVFVHFYGDKVILLLGGYDKGGRPRQRRQQRQIAEARRMLAQFKERRRRQRRGR